MNDMAVVPRIAPRAVLIALPSEEDFQSSSCRWGVST
jgi:hypothetical protein